MKQKMIFLLIFLGIFPYSCAHKHIDYMVPFFIKGEIFDTSTNKPLRNASVFIVSNNEELKKYLIGQSDEFGLISIVYNYWWTNEEYPSKQKKRIMIMISLSNYEPKVISYDLEKLPHTSENLVIDFKKVFLKPK